MNSGTLVRWITSWLEQSLLKRAPQEDAFSYPALAGALSAYVGIDLLQAISSSPWPTAWAITLVDTLAMVAFAWVVLQLTGKSPRLVQTLTALAGTGVVLGLVGLPLVLQAARAQQLGEMPASLAIGWLLMLAWSIAVQAHIFRHALTTRYGLGLVLAGLHTVLAFGLLEVFFPALMGSG